METKKLEQELNKLKTEVIGIFKTAENSHELVVGVGNQVGKIDTIKVTNFATIQKTFGIPIRYGKLILFEEGETLDKLLQDPHRFSELMKTYF